MYRVIKQYNSRKTWTGDGIDIIYANVKMFNITLTMKNVSNICSRILWIYIRNLHVYACIYKEVTNVSLVYLQITAPTHEQNNLKNTNTTQLIYRVNTPNQNHFTEATKLMLLFVDQSRDWFSSHRRSNTVYCMVRHTTSGNPGHSPGHMRGHSPRAWTLR